MLMKPPLENAVLNFLPFVATGIGLGAVYGMSAIGLVVLYRSSGTINFAFGALGAAGAHLTWAMIDYAGFPILPAWLAGVALATLLSYAYGHFVSSRLADRSQSVRAMATLGFALLILGVITTIFGPGLPRRLTLPTDLVHVTVLGVKISVTRILAFLFAVLTMVFMSLLLNRTRVGLAMRALANDRRISSQIGIDVARVDAFAWAISGMFAGICGLFFADLLLMSPIPLTFLVIPALAAAVLGRLTSMAWALAGGMIAGLAEALLTAVPAVSSMRSAAPYIVALVFMALMRSMPSGEQE